MQLRFFWNKHKFIRVIKFNSDKSSTITYYQRATFKPKYLVNPDHIFIANGYTTIIITDKAQETINPLDFKSQYDAEQFKIAINNKIIADTFSTLKTNKFDLTQIILFASVALNIIILYFTLKSNGVF